MPQPSVTGICYDPLLKQPDRFSRFSGSFRWLAGEKQGAKPIGDEQMQVQLGTRGLPRKKGNLSVPLNSTVSFAARQRLSGNR